MMTNANDPLDALRREVGSFLDLTDADVRRRVYAVLTQGCATNDPVRFSGVAVPIPPAEVLAEMLRKLKGAN
jgi:hypothetical protein